MNRASPRELIAAALLDFEWSEATDYGRSDALRFADGILALLSDSSLPGERERELEGALLNTANALEDAARSSGKWDGEGYVKALAYARRVLSASPTRSEPTPFVLPRDLVCLTHGEAILVMHIGDDKPCSDFLRAPDAGETTP